MIKRNMMSVLKERAKSYPVVTLTGPRQSGKSTLCQMAFPNYRYVNLEDLQMREFAQSDPFGFLQTYSEGVIIDEIQRAPNLTSQIQVAVDQRKKNGEYILIGSHNFSLINSVNQSLAGRTSLLTLLPLSFSEIKKFDVAMDLDSYLQSGFYPGIYDKKINPTVFQSDYIATYLERDLREIENINHLSLFQKFLGLCAGRIGNLLNLSSLSNEVGVSSTTLKNWLSILEASQIIYILKPFYKNVNKRLIKTPKIYFYDNGLAAYLLGIRKKEHLHNYPLAGALFENMVIMDLVKQNYNLDLFYDFYFYRDSSQNEIDVVVNQGVDVLPIEIKKSQTFSQSFLKGFSSFEEILDQKPKQRWVVYSGENFQERTNFSVKPYDQLVLK